MRFQCKRDCDLQKYPNMVTKVVRITLVVHICYQKTEFLLSRNLVLRHGYAGCTRKKNFEKIFFSFSFGFKTNNKQRRLKEELLGDSSVASLNTLGSLHGDSSVDLVGFWQLLKIILSGEICYPCISPVRTSCIQCWCALVILILLRKCGHGI